MFALLLILTMSYIFTIRAPHSICVEVWEVLGGKKFQPTLNEKIPHWKFHQQSSSFVLQSSHILSLRRTLVCYIYQIVRVFVSCLYTVFKWFPEQYYYYSITLWICSPLLPEHRSAWSESNAVTWCISSRWSIWRGKGFPRSGKRLHWRNRAGCIFCPSSLLLHLPHGSSSSRAAAESYFLPLHAG